jgi:hypothetical protein
MTREEFIPSEIYDKVERYLQLKSEDSGRARVYLQGTLIAHPDFLLYLGRYEGQQRKLREILGDSDISKEYIELVRQVEADADDTTSPRWNPI